MGRLVFRRSGTVPRLLRRKHHSRFHFWRAHAERKRGYFYDLYFGEGVANSAAYPCAPYVCGYADGWYTFGSIIPFTSMPDVEDLAQAPVLHTAQEYSSTSNGMRIHFVDDENDGDPSIQ